MNRQEFVARVGNRNNKFVLLFDIINLETGELFRRHCWVRRKLLPKRIVYAKHAIIQFKAKIADYKKKIPSENLNGHCIVIQKQLVDLTNISIVRKM